MHMLMGGIEAGFEPVREDLTALKRLAKCSVETPTLLEDLDTARGHAAVLLGVALPKLVPVERCNFIDPLITLAESNCSAQTAFAALDAVFEAFADDDDKPALAKADALARLTKVREVRGLDTEGEASEEEDGVRENLTGFLAYLKESSSP